MTEPSDQLPDDYEETVSRLESELGREVCGFPTENYQPCDQWPTEDSEYCRQHAGLDLEDFLNEQKTETGSTLPDPSPSAGTSTSPDDSGSSDATVSGWITHLQGSMTYWLGLLLAGFLLGATGAAWTVGTGFGPTGSVLNGAAEESEFNPVDPDFQQLRQLYRSGRHDMVARRLQSIVDSAKKTDIRARALYLSFVFNQRQKRYQRALTAADRFIDNFSDHNRRAEVLYGAWFISSQLLDNPSRAKDYRDTLLEEFPESKWAKRLSS
ncbi:MAG: tol-pal system YbgF family protein [bacterium]